MDNFNLKEYLAEGKLLKENESKVSQWLIDSFIDGVKDQKEYGEAWNLYATKGEEYDQLLTAAEETIASTDSGKTTPEELIDAAQLYALGKGIKSVDENKLNEVDAEEVEYMGASMFFDELHTNMVDFLKSNINSDYLGNVEELASDLVTLISSRTKEPKKYSDSYYK